MTTTRQAAKAEAREAKVAGLIASIAEQTEALLTSEGWLAFVAFTSKLHNYSANNLMLIAMQRPDATYVAGFQRWKELGRSVRKGEKGIAILAPMGRKTPNEETGESEYKVYGFRVVYVFDVSQTDGEELPVQVTPTLLDGEVPEGLWDKLAAQVAGHGFALEFGNHPDPDVNGYVTVAGGRKVVISPDRPALSQLKTLAHELGHIECGHVGANIEGLHRGRREVEAESVAAVVLGANGIDTSDYTTAYVAGWAKDAAEVKESAATVLKAARAILDRTEE